MQSWETHWDLREFKWLRPHPPVYHCKIIIYARINATFLDKMTLFLGYITCQLFRFRIYKMSIIPFQDI